MLIHIDNVRYCPKSDGWELYVPNVGSKNDAIIQFRSKRNEVPETGDEVVDNFLVKAKRD